MQTPVWTLLRLLLFVCLIAVGSLLPSQVSHAATLNVGCNANQTTRVQDLINAISSANSSIADDTINLTAGCTYTLTSVNNTNATGDNGLPEIGSTSTSGKLTITGLGNGATIARASGSPAFRMIYLLPGGNLTINNVSFSGGSSNFGGALCNFQGALTVNNSTFTSNTSGIYGGAIYNEASGTLTVSGSTFSNNTVTLGGSSSDGGAIFNIGTASISGSTFTNNSAPIGGAVATWNNSSLTIDNSRFSGNSAQHGGSLFIYASATATVNNSTLNTNTASVNGAAIYNDSTLYLTNSTLSGNTASNVGGGIFSAGTSAIAQSTLAGNTGTVGGGGIYAFLGTVSLSNTLIATNTAPSGPDIAGLVASQGYNLIGNSSGVTGIAMTDLTDAAATPLNLGALANNGGTTQTRALLQGSKAINAGNPAGGLTPFDQRGAGFPRVVDDRIDIGAYEAALFCPSFPVTLANGDSAGLINAIKCANTTTTNQVINLASGGTYTLTSVQNVTNGVNGLPAISDAASSGTLTINGNGATITRGAGAAQFRIFYVDDGGVLILNNLTVSNGLIGSDFAGGGIYNRGTVTISGCTISGNSARYAGGIFNSDTMTLTGSTVSGNSAEFGGGLYITAGADQVTFTNNTITGNSATANGGGLYAQRSMTISGSTFSNNSSGLHGGSIYDETSSLLISNSTLSNNSAQRGGGIYNNPNGTVEIISSFITGNTASMVGGGIYNTGILTISASTLAANTATGNAGGAILNGNSVSVNTSTFSGNSAVNGGGIYSGGGAMSISNSTFTGNEADVSGGALYLVRASSTDIYSSTFSGNSAGSAGFGGGGGLYIDSQFNNALLTIANTIVVGNGAETGPNIDGVISSSQGYNLFGDTSGGGGFVGTDLTNVLPSAANLGGLVNNGGPTQTLALMPGSVAIDAGNPAYVPPPNTDQRGMGFPRVRAGRIDIGAYEAPLSITCPAFPANIPNGNVTALINAIRCADDTSTNETINLAASGTYSLATASSPTAALPPITNAANSGTLTINGNNSLVGRASGATSSFRIFYVNNGAGLTLNSMTIANGAADWGAGLLNAGGNVTLNTVTLAGNRATMSGGGAANLSGSMSINNSTVIGNIGGIAVASGGGGLYNSATLTVTNTTLTENSTVNGGGFFNSAGGTATITGSTFSDNTAENFGGGVYNVGTLTVTNSTFSDNQTTSEINQVSHGGGLFNSGNASVSGSVFSGNSSVNYGGGAANNAGTLNIDTTTFTANHSGSGGGVSAYEGVVNINRSTISGNDAGSGGGAANTSGELTISNSTISGNTASSSVASGGGIQSYDTLTILNSTISGNTAASNAGGLSTFQTYLVLGNTIIAGNNATNTPDIESSSILTSLGYNLIGNSFGLTGTAPSDQVGVTAAQVKLGALANNGGPTQTMALLTGSIAINAGNPGFVPPPDTDQRGSGFPRIVGGRLDIGAYEASGNSLIVQLTLQGRPAAPNAAYVTTVHVQVRPSGGGAPVVSGDFTSSTSGQITIPNVPTGSYTLRVKGTHTLATTQAITLAAGSNNATTPLLKEGDADDSNSVVLVDFSLLAAAFGKSSAQTGYDARADFNQDGVVNLVDFSLLASNFNQAGAP